MEVNNNGGLIMDTNYKLDKDNEITIALNKVMHGLKDICSNELRDVDTNTEGKLFAFRIFYCEAVDQLAIQMKEWGNDTVDKVVELMEKEAKEKEGLDEKENGN